LKNLFIFYWFEDQIFIDLTDLGISFKNAFIIAFKERLIKLIGIYWQFSQDKNSCTGLDHFP